MQGRELWSTWSVPVVFLGVQAVTVQGRGWHNWPLQPVSCTHTLLFVYGVSAPSPCR